eukprot:TRINITY_DN16704_c0_g1_i1.p1 TRINITY_DN16704_c0_g1~~TRINITY_DN16704_c0_g1_i1.p1  ORF type:complete len:248 (+),score=56.59 TRINITY_DN16704_c0_g1_i1:81-746(+)
MLRRNTVRLFVAKSQADVVKDGKSVRMLVTPNSVSSYTKLPNSVKGMLGLVDAEAEQNEKEEKRKLISQLLRSGHEGKQTASVLIDKLRAQQTGKTTDISGPVRLKVIDAAGEVREIETFVTFGSEQEEKSALGKMVQIGLHDLKKLGVTYDYANDDLRFTAPTHEAPRDPRASSDDTEYDTRRVAPEDRKLAGSMLPSTPFSVLPPAVSPDTPLTYATKA